MSALQPPDPRIPELITSDTLLQTGLFNVSRARLRTAEGAPFERTIVEHPGAVALVALDAEGRWLLVWQYRHAAGRVLLELPAGTREPDEPPEVTAARELREETGFAAGSLRRLGGAWMAPGFTSEYIDFYLATDLVPDPLPADDDEGLSEPVALTREQVMAAVAAGEIEDAKTLVALAFLDAGAAGEA